MSIGYENNPALTSSKRSDLSLNECAKVKRWNGKKQHKYHESSVVWGTSDWR